MLALTAQLPDIERLNEVSLRLPLSDVAMKTLQHVNRRWIRAAATALDRCRWAHRSWPSLQLKDVNARAPQCLYSMAVFCLFLNLPSELQGSGLNDKFLHYCEKWVHLLERIEEELGVNIADDLPALREQQKRCEVNLCCLPPWGWSQGMT